MYQKKVAVVVAYTSPVCFVSETTSLPNYHFPLEMQIDYANGLSGRLSPSLLHKITNINKFYRRRHS
jgi:hypothetical protein